MSQNVFQAILAVSADLGAAGISKARENKQQGYAYRGIDDFLNALSPLLVKHGLVIRPLLKERTVTERMSKQGGTLIFVVVLMEYIVTLAADPGSIAICIVSGEGMDSGDKATNKAISTAYKYMATQLFCVPFTGSEDSESDTPEVSAKPTPKPTVHAPAAPAKPAAPPADTDKDVGMRKKILDICMKIANNDQDQAPAILEDLTRWEVDGEVKRPGIRKGYELNKFSGKALGAIYRKAKDAEDAWDAATKGADGEDEKPPAYSDKDIPF